MYASVATLALVKLAVAVLVVAIFSMTTLAVVTLVVAALAGGHACRGGDRGSNKRDGSVTAKM